MPLQLLLCPILPLKPDKNLFSETLLEINLQESLLREAPREVAWRETLPGTPSLHASAELSFCPLLRRMRLFQVFEHVS